MISTFTVYYRDGSIESGLTYEESLDLFERRAETNVSSIAPTITSDTY